MQVQTARASHVGRRAHRSAHASTRAVGLTFGPGELRQVRRLVAGLAHEAGLSRHRTDELTVVVNELAANSVDHGGGRGTMRGWLEPDALVVEVSDAGTLGESAQGRSAGIDRPQIDSERGRGLWIARQLADELEVLPAGHDADGARGTLIRVVTAR